MYATLPLNGLIKIVAWIVLPVFALLLYTRGYPEAAAGWLRIASGAAFISGFLLLVLFGPSGRWSPWRALWRLIPILNDVVFPDLNGTWQGTTASNWPRIDAVRKAAASGHSLSLDVLEAIPLLQTPIIIEIKASLFNLHIWASLPNTDSTSVAQAGRVQRRQDGRFVLFYVYSQETGSVAFTDESQHDGAARLAYSGTGPSLKGSYWTKRTWQCGTNTAGQLEVARTDRQLTAFR